MRFCRNGCGTRVDRSSFDGDFCSMACRDNYMGGHRAGAAFSGKCPLYTRHEGQSCR